jgi:hypothetical protein
MMDYSEAARSNAIALEAKKDGLSQKQNGDWILRVVIAAADMDGRITKAAMGTRWQCAFVEVNDDETPVDHKAMDRDKWRGLGPVKQSGIRCKDPVFWSYLMEELHFPPIQDEDMAATCIREQCQIESRGELAKAGSQRAREIWHKLDFGFQAWRAKESHG